MPNSLTSSAIPWTRMLPDERPSGVPATAISPAPINSASSAAVVRVVPSRQSPRSATA